MLSQALFIGVRLAALVALGTVVFGSVVCVQYKRSAVSYCPVYEKVWACTSN